MYLDKLTYPTAWHGQFEGKRRVAVVIRDAIADHSLCTWEGCFRMPGSNKEINVLDAPPFLSNIANGSYPSSRRVQLNEKHN